MLLLNSCSAIIIFAELMNNFCLVRQDSTEVLLAQFYSPFNKRCDENPWKRESEGMRYRGRGRSEWEGERERVFV